MTPLIMFLVGLLVLVLVLFVARQVVREMDIPASAKTIIMLILSLVGLVLVLNHLGYPF